MKTRKITILLVFAFYSILNLQAQQEKEMEYIMKGDEPMSINFYGGPTITFSTVYDHFALLMGGDAGIMLNKVMVFGVYGERYMSKYEETIKQMFYEDEEFNNLTVNLRFNQMGVWLGYIYKSNKPVHFGINSKFGWGRLRWKSDDDNEPPEKLKDNVFVITPKFEVEFNLTPWSKMVVGAGYRFVTGINETYLTNEHSLYPDNIYETKLFDPKAFDSFVVNLGFFFGNFK